MPAQLYDPDSGAGGGRPAGKARRLRIPPVFEGGATQPPGMHRPSNAARLLPRAAMAQEKPKSLYDGLGGVYSIATLVDDFIEWLLEAELIDVFASAGFSDVAM